MIPKILTSAQILAIPSPNVGHMVFDTTLNLPKYYNGTSWINISIDNTQIYKRRKKLIDKLLSEK